MKSGSFLKVTSLIFFIMFVFFTNLEDISAGIGGHTWNPLSPDEEKLFKKGFACDSTDTAKIDTLQKEDREGVDGTKDACSLLSPKNITPIVLDFSATQVPADVSVVNNFLDYGEESFVMEVLVPIGCGGLIAVTAIFVLPAIGIGVGVGTSFSVGSISSAELVKVVACAVLPFIIGNYSKKKSEEQNPITKNICLKLNNEEYYLFNCMKNKDLIVCSPSEEKIGEEK